MLARNKLGALLIVLLFAAVFVWSCGGGNDTALTSQSYNGPGSEWSSSINSNGTFSLAEAISGLSLAGTWTNTAAGFKLLVVTSSNDTASVAIGSLAYVLDIPGTVLILKPFNSNQIITMVKSGACPSADFNANWVVTNKDDTAPIATTDVVGTFAYTHATTSAGLPTKYSLAGGASMGSSNLGSFSCSNGIADVTGAKMYLTQVGGAIVHTTGGTPNDPSDDDFIVAMPATTIVDMASLNGTYLGLGFAGAAAGDSVFPISIILSNGVGSGTEINADTGIAAAGTVAVDFTGAGDGINNPSAGFISGTVDDGSGSKQVTCMASTNINSSGKNFMFCVGENPGETGKMYNMLMISM